ncbi:MAG TPA: hypothetical protein VFS60_01290 [Thermoanaerobaculia bacterium]|nr:hypothetical protein [Thermoanaerobaculia bacterium]
MRQRSRWWAMTLASFALAVAPTSLAAAGGAPGGDDATSVVTPAIPDALIAQLLLLSDDACEVLYVPGTLDRAAHVETWLRSLAVGAARRTRHPARLVGVVLPREEWQQAKLPCAYGIPCRAGARVVALPAAGDAGTVALWQGLLGALPRLAGMPLMGTAEEASSLAPVDSLAGLVAARDLVVAAGLAGDEPWVTDVIAHALNLDAARQTRSGRAEDLDGFWGTILQRYGPLGVEPADPQAVELHHQAKLFLAAHALLGSDGNLPARTLRKLQEKGGGTIRGADLRATWPVALGGL